MKFIKTLFKIVLRVLLIVSAAGSILAAILIRGTSISGVDQFLNLIMDLLPGVGVLLALRFPYLPFAAQIAAFGGYVSLARLAGYSYSPEIQRILEAATIEIDNIGSGYIFIIIGVTLPIFIAIAGYRWIGELLIKKVSTEKTGYVELAAKKMKAFLRPGQDMIFWSFWGILFLMILLGEMLGNKYLIIAYFGIWIVASAMVFTGSFPHADRVPLIKDLARNIAFSRSISGSPVIEQAAVDFNNADRQIDGRLLVGQKYLFGKKAGAFLAYDQIAEMTVYSVVDGNHAKKGDHYLKVKTSDGQEFILCKLKATNAFQSIDRYCEKKVYPVFDIIKKKNPSCQYFTESKGIYIS